MASGRQHSYIVLVAENDGNSRQWAIRVDYLLSCLALGMVLSLYPIAMPLLHSRIAELEHRAIPKPSHEIQPSRAPSPPATPSRISLAA